MNMTPAEAEKTICPLSMPRDKLRFCQGAQCQLWRWSDKEREEARDAEFVEAMKALGFDPSSNKRPNSLQVAEAKRIANEAVRDWSGTRGGCGLKGAL